MIDIVDISLLAPPFSSVSGPSPPSGGGAPSGLGFLPEEMRAPTNKRKRQIEDDELLLFHRKVNSYGA